MGQEKVKGELPQYLQGYGDPVKRKAYMKKYMRERYRVRQAAAGKPVKTREETISMKIDESVDAEMAQAKNMIGDSFDAIKTIAGKDADEDPVIKAIMKYGPLALKFLEGFAAAARDQSARAQAANAQPPPPRGPTPPPGWIYMSAIERLKRKYTGEGAVTLWYQQGEEYESMTAGEYVSDRPVGMTATTHGARIAQEDAYAQAVARRRAAAYVPATPPPRDMAEIEARTAAQDQALPLVKEKPATVTPPPEKVAETTANAEKLLEETGQAMMEDVRRNLGIVIEYFKTRPLDKFENDLENVEDYIKTWAPILKMTLGFHVKESMKRLSAKDLLVELEKQDPKKAALVKRKKLEKKLTTLWEGILKEL